MKLWTIHVQIGVPEAIGSNVPNLIKDVCFQGTDADLGELVEEQHSAMSLADRAGPGHPAAPTDQGRDTVNKMVRVADMTRSAFINGDLSTVMSPRTVITWAENAEIFGNVGFAFRLTFLNKCDELERAVVAEFYQRAFGEELKESAANVVLG